MSYSGNWQRGRELMERAMVLNPRHPGFLWYPLVHDAYRQKDYSRALDYALRVNLPGQFWTHLVLAMVHGQLRNRDAAARALQELLAISPDFPEHARQEIEKFFYAQLAHAEHVLEGLGKAGLDIPGNPLVVETRSRPRAAQARCRPTRTRRNVRLVNRSKSPRLATSRSSRG
jgi:tetratricopeptide (TPR) repeat protein